MAEKEDLAVKWWKTWIEADLLDREKMTENVIVDAIMEVFNAKDMSDKMIRHVLVNMMQSYLDDFYETMDSMK